jgi:ubiquinone/menaquinone biosynthesis C-methylase UbiE
MTTQGFFTDGAAYEQLMGRWSRSAGEVFLDWLALPTGLNWLDVGCGTGAFTELLLARCAPGQIDAIDPAEDQIAFAKTRPGMAGVTFRVGDAQALPFPDHSFDAVAMALVINFVPDAAKAVAEMKRVTRPGGTAGTYMWDWPGGRTIQQPLIHGIKALNVEVPSSTGQRNSGMDELRRFFEGAGFERVETRAIDIEVSYASFDDYWSSQTGLANPVVQAVRQMSPSHVERLKTSLRASLSRRDGRVAYPARANAVKGRVC